MSYRTLLIVSFVLNLVLGGVLVSFVGRRAMQYLNRGAPIPLARARSEHLQELAVTARAKGVAPVEFVMLGDSLTEFGEWGELLQRPIANRGVLGDTIADVHSRLDAVIALQPKLVGLTIGTNDVRAGKSPAQIARDHAALVHELRERVPNVRVIAMSLPAVNESMLATEPAVLTCANILRVNAAVAETAKKAGTEWLDVTTPLLDPAGQLDARFTWDGVHLSAAGYRVWAESLRRYLERP